VYSDIYDDIPEELRAQNIWVCCSLEPGYPKAKKVPYQIDGQKADVSDSTTWTSFETCAEAVIEGRYHALSFAICPPYIGIDFDHCRECDVIKPSVADAITVFNSYTEVSASGTGTHTLIKGTLPVGHNRKGNVELYDHSRFFICTGDRLTSVSSLIEYRQAEIESLYYALWPLEDQSASLCSSTRTRPVNLSDAEILGRAQKAKDGQQFRKRWTGMDVVDHSAADLSLCCLLAFWTGNDSVRIDLLFRQSFLYRKKWDRKDYRDRTIKLAIERTHVTFGGR
jgi:primase-polymerase (primpol)-like protein